MDFFARQYDAKKRSTRLVIYFTIAVAMIIAAVYFAFAIVLTATGSSARQGLWDPGLFFMVAGGTILVVGLGSLYKWAQLGKGGAAVARLVGGTPVNPSTKDHNERKLMNVVEEMAIASGVPVPQVFVLQGESGINAFAAGLKTDDAAVGVTRGAIEQLSRDELQGVIAHEFSHILHGDMRLNVRLMGVLHGILIIALAGYFIMRSVAFSGRSSRSSDSKAGGAIAAIFGVGALLMAIGYIGLFFGRLIKAAVSRQREFLADAAAVQFTRNPDGIAGALKKIGGFKEGSRVQNKRAEEASHMFFGDALKKRMLFSGLLATHPPLEMRIKAIDMSFQAEGGTTGASTGGREEVAGLAGLAGAPSGARGRKSAFRPTANRKAEIRRTPEQVLERIGAPSPEHVSYGASLLKAVPEDLRELARESYGAQALIYALLLDTDDTIMAKQLEQLKNHADKTIHRETIRIAPSVVILGRTARLPLIDISLPALRELSKTQFEVFKKNIQVLVDADEKVSLFEFTLQKILLSHLKGTHATRVREGRRTAKSLQTEIGLIIATLAYAGHETTEAAREAFDLARTRLSAKLSIKMAEESRCKLTAFGVALDEVAKGKLNVRHKVLDACAYCVAADGIVTVEEAELLRAIADGLGCPLPPFLPDEDGDGATTGCGDGAVDEKGGGGATEAAE